MNMKRWRGVVERSLLLPVASWRVPYGVQVGDRFRLPKRFSVSFGLSYQAQPIREVLATLDHWVDEKTAMARIRLAA